MKRWSIVVGLLTLLLVFMGALAGCSPAAEGLQNAAGVGDGPGSGRWKPQTPANARQARQLHETLQTLRRNANEESGQYDKLYAGCLNEEGRLRSGDEADACVQPLVASWLTLEAYFRDFMNGRSAYVDWAQRNDDAPSPPDLPNVPQSGSPSAEIIELGGGQNWTGCLTCTHRLDVEYVFRPAPVEIEAPAS